MHTDSLWLLASMLLNFLWSYSQACKDMQAELDAARKDAAEERVSMQAELDAATKDAAEERVSMQAELDAAMKDVVVEAAKVRMLRLIVPELRKERDSMQTELRKESEDLRAELEKTKAERDSMQTELTKNTLKHERASMQHEEENRKVNSLQPLIPRRSASLREISRH